MGQYKFRGKRIDNGEWAYGSLFNGMKKKLIMKVATVKPERENVYPMIGFEVIPGTVGQYTGLPDRNGKEIYRGDVVKLRDYHGNRIVEISYHNGVYYYGGDGFSDEYLFNSSDREVIGNIYDNPELLRGE